MRNRGSENKKRVRQRLLFIIVADVTEEGDRLGHSGAVLGIRGCDILIMGATKPFKRKNTREHIGIAGGSTSYLCPFLLSLSSFIPLTTLRVNFNAQLNFQIKIL